jgi:Zn-dependent membrane protease YugP
LKKFKQAYSYYSKIKDYDNLDKDRVAKTLLSFIAVNDANIKYLNDELDSL